MSAIYMRLRAAGYTSGHILFNVVVASGNISAAYYTNSGTGVNSKPIGGQLATTGAMACPAAGVATVALGSSVTPHLADWIAMSADNSTATFTTQSTFSNTALGSGLAWYGQPRTDTSCTTQGTTTVLDGNAATADVGKGIYCAGNIPAGATIISAVANTSYVISAAASTSAGSLTFIVGPYPLPATPAVANGAYTHVMMKGSA